MRFTLEGEPHEVHAEFVVGADGFHGVTKTLIPARAASRPTERDYDAAWLGILADVPPSTDELIYALHPDGFAMHSMRSPSVSRLYVQVDPDERIEEWSDDRIWEALDTRLATPGWRLEHGPDHREVDHADAVLGGRRRSRTAACSSSATPATSSRRPARRG